MLKSIKAIDRTSVHHITSGQVVIDLQNAVKELLENSMDAGATNIEIRFKQYGLKSVEVIDNGCGIAEADHDNIALKHHTSKLESFSDLSSISSFGFRGEALSSLCALSANVTVTTATSSTAPVGTCLVMDSSGKAVKKSTVARQQGTTVLLTNLFSSLPVRRKEFERNIKREYGKALSLLTAYALGPCAAGNGVRLIVSNQPEKGPKTIQINTLGSPSSRSSISALWGAKSLENVVDMNFSFEVEREKSSIKRLQSLQNSPVPVRVKGLISKFAVGCGRSGTDRQFFYINGRPCDMSNIQKGFNEIYRSFNANQSPFILADFVLPTDAYDVNVSPDKRTILLHNEGNLIVELKAALELKFANTRATYDVEGGLRKPKTQSQNPGNPESDGASEVHSKNLVEQDQGGHENSQSRTSVAVGINPSPSTSFLSIGNPTSIQNDQSSSLPTTSQHLPLFENHAGSVATTDSPVTQKPEKDRMSIDDDEGPPSIQEIPSSSVVLDTSQTTWGRHLRTVPQPAFSPQIQESITAQDRKRTESTSTNLGPARKKQKPDTQSMLRGERQADVNEENQSNGCAQLTSLKTTGIPGSSSGHSLLGGSGSQRTLRRQLASFARPGSQLSVASTLTDNIEQEEFEDLDELDQEDQDSDSRQEKSGEDVDRAVDDHRQGLPPKLATGQPNSPPVSDGNASVDDEDREDPMSLLSQARTNSSGRPSTISQKVHPEIVKTDKLDGDLSLRLDMDKLKFVWSQRPSNISEPDIVPDGKETFPSDAGVSNTIEDEKAVDALSRVIKKKDFEEMVVVGQFNLGFIVVRRHSGRADEMDDLFIVDQHAADEKYNFETLQATTKIQSQKLFRSQYLELTASDELLASENIDVLRQNGFEIDIDDNSTIRDGGRLKLSAIPVSKGTVFDVKDLEEIVHLMRDLPTGQMVRCSKARAMFAMRACRKSVMVGMPLTQQQMVNVIRHMGTIDQPWNCPHGRPTMRHLTDIRETGLRNKDRIDWSSFR